MPATASAVTGPSSKKNSGALQGRPRIFAGRKLSPDWPRKATPFGVASIRATAPAMA
jgi:hypothetical protein